MKIDLIERLGLGAFVGCFVVMLVMVLGSYIAGPEKVSFSGLEIMNAFFGSLNFIVQGIMKALGLKMMWGDFKVALANRKTQNPEGYTRWKNNLSTVIQ